MSKNSVVGQAWSGAEPGKSPISQTLRDETQYDVNHPMSSFDPKWIADPKNNNAKFLHPLEVGTAMAYNELNKSDVPDMQKPGAAPTAQGANQVALNNQLNQEVSMRQSRTNFSNSGGGGLLDDEPKTASRVLLGS